MLADDLWKYILQFLHPIYQKKILTLSKQFYQWLKQGWGKHFKLGLACALVLQKCEKVLHTDRFLYAVLSADNKEKEFYILEKLQNGTFKNWKRLAWPSHENSDYAFTANWLCLYFREENLHHVISVFTHPFSNQISHRFQLNDFNGEQNNLGVSGTQHWITFCSVEKFVIYKHNAPTLFTRFLEVKFNSTEDEKKFINKTAVIQVLEWNNYFSILTVLYGYLLRLHLIPINEKRSISLALNFCLPSKCVNCALENLFFAVLCEDKICYIYNLSGMLLQQILFDREEVYNISLRPNEFYNFIMYQSKKLVYCPLRLTTDTKKISLPTYVKKRKINDLT